VLQHVSKSFAMLRIDEDAKAVKVKRHVRPLFKRFVPLISCLVGSRVQNECRTSDMLCNVAQSRYQPDYQVRHVIARRPDGESLRLYVCAMTDVELYRV
jgi:hypothetical protein